jgi:hypothetical protein
MDESLRRFGWPARSRLGYKPYAGGVDFLSNGLFGLIELACLVVAVWALVDCARRATPAFPAAGKLTKPAWLAITGGAVLVQYLFAALTLFGIAAIVASIVYLVDVRPAVREVQGGGRWS